MLIKAIAGCTRIIGKAQGYIGLPLRDEMVRLGPDAEPIPAMVTAWEPTPTEMRHITAGGTIYLRILGTEHPPLFMWAEPPPSVGPGSS